MIKRNILGALICAGFALCGGCSLYTEPDAVGIVIGISIEKSDDEFAIYCEIADMQGSDLSASAAIAKGRGPTPKAASLACEKDIGKPLYWAHLQAVVLAGQFEAQDIMDISEFINTDSETPLSVKLIAAPQSSAEQIWEDEDDFGKKVSELRSFVVVETLNCGITQAPDMPFYKFYRDINGKKKSALLPVLQDGKITDISYEITLN